MTGMAGDQQIIRTGTRLGPVPLVPEIRLHQASDPISLWQRTEAASGRTGLDPPFWAFAWAAPARRWPATCSIIRRPPGAGT